MKINLNNLTILLFVMTITLLVMRPIHNYDIWWHLNSGLWMIENGKVLDFDIWSFTQNGEKWTNISWLFQLIVATFFQLFDLWGLFYLKAICIFFIYYFLLKSLDLRQTNLFYAFIFVFLIFLPFILGHLILRPHLFELCALTFLLWNSRKPYDTKRATFSFLVLILWANSHSSVVVASFAFSALAMFGEWEYGVRKREKIIFALCFLFTPFITPFGIQILELLFKHGSSDFIGFYVGEWVKHDAYPAILWLSTLLILFFYFNKKIKLNIAECFLIVFFLYYSYKHQRFDVELAVLLYRPLSEIIGAGLNELQKRSKNLPILLTLLFIITHGLLYNGHIRSLMPLLDSYISYEKYKYPSVTIKMLLNLSDNLGRNLKILNDYTLGAYISFSTKGAAQVLVDGRMSTVFPESLLIPDYESSYANLQNMAKRYEVDGILLNLDKSSVIPSDDPNWALVGYDSASVLFVKRILADLLGWENIRYNPSKYSNSYDNRALESNLNVTKNLLEIEPNNPVALNHVAVFLSSDMSSNNTAKIVFDYLKNSEELNPNDIFSSATYAYLLATNSEGNKSIADFLKYVPSAKELTSGINLSYDLAYANMFIKIELSNEALNYLYPDNFKRRRDMDSMLYTWKLRVIAHSNLGEISKAENCLDIAYELIDDTNESELREIKELTELIDNK